MNNPHKIWKCKLSIISLSIISIYPLSIKYIHFKYPTTAPTIQSITCFYLNVPSKTRLLSHIIVLGGGTSNAQQMVVVGRWSPFCCVFKRVHVHFTLRLSFSQCDSKLCLPSSSLRTTPRNLHRIHCSHHHAFASVLPFFTHLFTQPAGGLMQKLV